MKTDYIYNLNERTRDEKTVYDLRVTNSLGEETYFSTLVPVPRARHVLFFEEFGKQRFFLGQIRKENSDSRDILNGVRQFCIAKFESGLINVMEAEDGS